MAALSSIVCLVTPMRSHISWVVPTWNLCMSFGASLATNSFNPILISLLVLTCFCSVVGGFTNEMNIRCLIMQRDISERQRLGFSHLLTRLTDVLLELDADFRITAPCANLAAMLFLNS